MERCGFALLFAPPESRVYLLLVLGNPPPRCATPAAAAPFSALTPFRHNIYAPLVFRLKKPYRFISAVKVHPDASRLAVIAGLLLVLLAPVPLRAAPGDPLGSPDYRDLAWACYQQGDYANAITNLTQALRQHPRDAWAWNCLALARENLGDLPGALAGFSLAAEIKPDDAGVYYNCGRLLQYDTNKPGIAIADYTEAIRLEPANAGLHVIRARAYRERMNFDPAWATIARPSNCSPPMPGFILRGAGSRWR